MKASEGMVTRAGDRIRRDFFLGGGNGRIILIKR